MHIGRLLLLPLPYKLDSVSPFDFPFFYWVEEMKRKEGNEQKKKKRQHLFPFVYHSKLVHEFWGRGEIKNYL